MVEISSPLSKENRIQISRASTISGLTDDRYSILSQNPVNSQQNTGSDPETLKILEANQTSLSVVSSGIESLRQRIDILSSSLSSLSSVIVNNSILENFRENQRINQERSLAEQALRDESEAVIERKIQSSIEKPVESIAENTTSRLNSLMGAFSKLFFGWLGLQNISSIKSLISGVSKKLFLVGDIVKGIFDKVKNVFLGIKNGFDDVISGIIKVSSKIAKIITEGLIINPFKLLFPDKTKVKPEVKSATNAATETATETASKTGAEATAKAATKTETKAATEAITETATKTETKGLTRFFPGLNIAASAYFAQQNLKENDIIGAGFDFGGMLPGAPGWLSIGAGALYETVTKGGIKGIPDMSKMFNQQPQNPTPPKPTPNPQKTSSNVTTSKNNLVASLPEQSSGTSSEKITEEYEKRAEEVTPTGNLAFNFGDQITNISNKVFSQTKGENQNLPTNISFVLGMKEEPKMETYSESIEKPDEKLSISPIQKSSAIVETIPKREPSVGPSPKSQPNIIITPIPQTQQSSPSAPSSPGNDVPAIPSSNPGNFYALYSKVHYNIV